MIRLAPMLTALLLLAVSFSQPTMHRVPNEYVSFAGEALTIDTGEVRDTFVAGLGWLSGTGAPAPLRLGDALYVEPLNLARFRLPADPADAPATTAPTDPAPDGPGAVVRFGGDSEVRVVLDLPELSGAGELRALEQQGRLGQDEVLLLDLPPLTLPPEQPDPYRGIDVSLLPIATGTRFELRGPELNYRVFALESPTRLVVDVVPLRPDRIPATSETLMEGVTYRTFGSPTPVGYSLVHLLEIAPETGEFRVVGTNEVARTLSELADGAFAAINAGYFDTSTFQAIGLLRVDYGLQSLPSRNRASIGFGFGGPVMTRVSAKVDVRIGGRLYQRASTTGDDAIQAYTAAGALVGNGRRGALVTQHGRVVANRVGPVTVPGNGFVIVYPPEDRDFALVDPGMAASIEVEFEPDAFQTVRYAVEAGPLLLEGGRVAFQPDREEFARGDRILDAYTQQAAIGLRSDGTVLLLVADNMRAEDLVQLFLSLGASDAMRLDSGSSATLLADGRVLNRARERRIVSAIVFLPRSM